MTAPNELTREAAAKNSQTLELAISWLVVGIPAAWGIWQVVIKSLALFRR
ncbi:MAG: oxalate:formate antiporter [Gemmatimonadaceae bacterium]